MSFKDYTKEELNKIKDMFNFLDKKSSGQLSVEDVKLGIIGLGGDLTNKEISELKNKFEYFKLDDFINLCKKKKIDFNELENKLLLAFSLLETNKKGFIPSTSLENLLKNDNVSDNDINKIINEAKPDKNNNIDYKSLVKDIMEANSDDEENNDNQNNLNDDEENDKKVGDNENED